MPLPFVGTALGRVALGLGVGGGLDLLAGKAGEKIQDYMLEKGVNPKLAAAAATVPHLLSAGVGLGIGTPGKKVFNNPAVKANLPNLTTQGIVETVGPYLHGATSDIARNI